MSDNTTRPSTSGGDTIRSDDVGSSVKVQGAKVLIGLPHQDRGFASRVGNLGLSVRRAGAFEDTEERFSRMAAAARRFAEKRTPASLDPLRRRAASPVRYTGGYAPPVVVSDIVSVLGARCYARFGQSSYVGATGVWTDSVHGFITATGGGSNGNPSAGSFPSGYSVPVFAGAVGTTFQATEITTGITTLPTYSASDYFLLAFIINFSALSSGNEELLVDDTAFVVHMGLGETGDGNNKIGTTDGAETNAAVSASTNYRVVWYGNGSGSKIVLNGVTQTATGTGGIGSTWKTNNFSIGGNSAFHPLNAKVGEWTFARDATDTFTADIANIDAALVAAIG